MDISELQNSFYVIVFHSTTDTIQTEGKLKSKVKTMIIPTPREISKSCGFAIRFLDVPEDEIIEITRNIDVPHALYFLSKKDGEQRTAKLVKELV